MINYPRPPNAAIGGPTKVTNVSIVQNNPVTRDLLKQLRESSEMVAAGTW